MPKKAHTKFPTYCPFGADGSHVSDLNPGAGHIQAESDDNLCDIINQITCLLKLIHYICWDLEMIQSLCGRP